VADQATASKAKPSYVRGDAKRRLSSPVVRNSCDRFSSRWPSPPAFRVPGMPTGIHSRQKPRMGKPDAKRRDQIVSVTPGYLHIIMVPSPGGPVPAPISHPCASMIQDKVAKEVKAIARLRRPSKLDHDRCWRPESVQLG
jgi:hypothetical protein